MVFQKAAGDYVNARSLVWGSGWTGRGKRRRRMFRALQAGSSSTRKFESITSSRSGISAWYPGEPCQASIAAASLNFTIKQESALNPPTSDRTLPRATTLPPDAPKVGPAADEYSGMRLAFFTLANAIK